MRTTRWLVPIALLAACSAFADGGLDSDTLDERDIEGAGCEASSPALTPAAIDPATSRRIDAVFADVGRSDTPGYALGLARSGRLLYAGSFGQANLDDGVPITSRTSFHLASLSKQFTAAAIALLVLDGKISLDDPVGGYIPGAAKYGPDLKIKHLIYMTSGIGDYASQPRLSGMPWFTSFYFTRDEAITAALRPPELQFAPGQQWSYSNINYMLLTKIVETVSGQRFSAFMRERVFAPLCMNATHIDDDTTLIVPHRATGYAARSREIIETAQGIGITILPGQRYARMLRVSPHFGGSGVFSTLEDLARWNGNFENARLGGAAFVELMQKVERFPHGKTNDAFGLVLGKYDDRPMWWYSGGDADASTYMARFADDHLTVICLSNLHDGDCEGRAKRVLDVLATDQALPSRAESAARTVP